MYVPPVVFCAFFIFHDRGWGMYSFFLFLSSGEKKKTNDRSERDRCGKCTLVEELLKALLCCCVKPCRGISVIGTTTD